MGDFSECPKKVDKNAWIGAEINESDMENVWVLKCGVGSVCKCVHGCGLLFIWKF